MPPAPTLEGFDAAIAWFRSRVPVTDDDFEDLDQELKQQAFTVSGVAQLELVSDVWTSLDKAVESGTDFADFKDAISERLSSAWGEERPWRLETIFRTWVQRSYGAGRYETMTNPVVKKLRPYWQFLAVLDSRTSDVCEQCDEKVLPADDPFWAEHQPPLHFNCRSSIVTLTPEEALELGVDEPPPNAPAAQGFGAPPTHPYEPDLTDFPPAVVNVYQHRRAA